MTRPIDEVSKAELRARVAELEASQLPNMEDIEPLPDTPERRARTDAIREITTNPHATERIERLVKVEAEYGLALVKIERMDEALTDERRARNQAEAKSANLEQAYKDHALAVAASEDRIAELEAILSGKTMHDAHAEGYRQGLEAVAKDAEGCAKRATAATSWELSGSAILDLGQALAEQLTQQTLEWFAERIRKLIEEGEK